MKKITFLIFLITCFFGFSQSWTTNTVTLDTDFTVKIDVNATTVQMTMVGPDGIWLAVGFTDLFDTSSGMAQYNGEDVVTYNSSGLVDRTFGAGNFLPSSDSNQDWTISPGGDTSSGGVRTVIATRSRSTAADNTDYLFPAGISSFNILWAKGGSDGFAYHTGGRGLETANLVLGNEDFQLNPARFTISPNPSRSDLNVGITYDPSRTYNLEVYDVPGKQIYRGQLNKDNTAINASNWKAGVYLVKLSSDEATLTKRFIKQ